MKWMAKLVSGLALAGCLLVSTGGKASNEQLSTEWHVHGVITSVEPTVLTISVGNRTITGRIRSEFFGWLNRTDNRARVRAVRAAHAHHGGTGAFYVLLRRRSSASNRSLRATPQR